MFNLLRPWAFLQIRPVLPDMRWVIYFLPAIFSGIVILTSFLINSDGTDIFSNDSILIKIGGLVQSLPGFYIAALTAIATFHKPDLDQHLLGTPLYLVDYQGNRIQLTRRRFLCVMLSYLTVQSITFSLLCILINNWNYTVFCSLNFKFLPFIVGYIIYFLFFQFLTITLWSIFYLGERIHTPNP
jgi:hypothetical protein